MSRFAIVLTFLTALSAEAAVRPLVGDVVHGKLLLEKAAVSDKTREASRVDGAWLNAYPDTEALAHLARGSAGFPKISSPNVLDRWDALAALRAQNTELRDLDASGDHVLVTNTKLDEHATKRLTDRAKIAASAIAAEHRVFTLYRLAPPDPSPARPGELTIVSAQDTKRRDELKKDAKTGYVVFVPIPGLRGGAYEAAFAIDTDIRVQKIVVRAPDGSTPGDLNRAAARFVGKGARGRYDALKAGGAGRALAELQRPLSDAFLLAAEAVYMFEREEREYFEFGG